MQRSSSGARARGGGFAELGPRLMVQTDAAMNAFAKRYPDADELTQVWLRA